VRVLKSAICLVMLGAGIAALPSQPGAASPAAAGDGQLIQELRQDARGEVVTSRESATGKVGFVRVEGGRSADLMPDVAADDRASAIAKTRAFLDDYAGVFGARPGELVRDAATKSRLGWNVSYVQRYRGVPVFGGALRAQVDSAGDLISVNGYVAPDLKLDVDPRLSAAEAGRAALAEVKADPPGHDGQAADLTGVAAKDTKLAIYRTGVPRGDVGKAVLAYVVEVSNDANVREMVFIDANTGKPLNRYSRIHEGLYRELYEGNTNRSNRVWAEGEPLPGTLNQEQQDLVAGTGESYWFFMNTFEQDSYDGLGATMTTVNNDPRINCPNANWNGVTTNYCNGVTSDDVVAHEWGHAYTEKSWDGIYQWQPGALNESFSDVWGETIDLINGRQTDGPQTTRTVGQCSKYTRGPVDAVINSPVGVAGPCTAAPAAFGPVFDQTGVTTDVIVGTDGVGTTTDGCTALTNSGDVAGNFVYLDRGSCTFQEKVDTADAAGATGIVVGDNVAGRAPISMSGTADIYGLMVTLEDGARIKSVGEVNMTVNASATDPVDDSYRWLMSEDSTAFGGAIRDMWNPNCYGDPGKVTDAEYQCSTDDGGGVHSNSGVPNHAYALLVDGGTFNGSTVTGIGLDKAAHVYYYAMQLFQTPTTDFVDHADALEATCDLLVEEEVDIYELSVDPNATPNVVGTMSDTDCDQVTAAIAAVELRTEPVQCNFTPLLDPGGPSLCGAGTTTTTVWSETFEDGLAGWEKDSEIVFNGGGSLPWSSDSTPPGGRSGTVARGDDNPNSGQCTEGTGDYSSRDSIVSPEIVMPATLGAPKLSFDHYVATEFEYDGGNVKMSVNGEAFAPIAPAAYLFNAPATELQPTNPLGGELGFTGSDGGEVGGSWGTSYVDLQAAGVKAGDSVRLRFDFGRDGCGGLDGWYVDNVKVTNCTTGTPPPPADLESETTLKIKPRETLDFGQDFRAKIKVKAAGVVPTGKVKLYVDGNKVGKGTLKNGKLVIEVTRNLPPGKHKVVAEYLGADNVEESQDKVTITVEKP
jgi:Zn-dependent metalloprotease